MRAKEGDVDTLDVVNIVTQANAKRFQPAHATSPRPRSILKAKAAAEVTPSPKAQEVRTVLYLHVGPLGDLLVFRALGDCDLSFAALFQPKTLA